MASGAGRGARARACVRAWIFRLAVFFSPSLSIKTKAGYVSPAVDTKAPPDFALSSSALFANLRRGLPGVDGIGTGLEV